MAPGSGSGGSWESRLPVRDSSSSMDKPGFPQYSNAALRNEQGTLKTCLLTLGRMLLAPLKFIGLLDRGLVDKRIRG